MEQNISTKAGKSVTWAAVDVVFRRFIKIFRTAVLARFLTPADFGILGIGFAVFLLELLRLLVHWGLMLLLCIKKKSTISIFLHH